MGYLAAVAKAIADTLEHALPDTVTVDDHERGGHGFDTPHVVVGLPDIILPNYDEPDTELGAWDWDTTWPVTLLVAFTGERDDTRQALDLTEAIIAAFHVDPTGGGVVEDLRVVDVRSGYNDATTTQRLVVIEFDVAAFSTRST